MMLKKFGRYVDIVFICIWPISMFLSTVRWLLHSWHAPNWLYYSTDFIGYGAGAGAFLFVLCYGKHKGWQEKEIIQTLLCILFAFAFPVNPGIWFNFLSSIGMIMLLALICMAKLWALVWLINITLQLRRINIKR